MLNLIDELHKAELAKRRDLRMLPGGSIKVYYMAKWIPCGVMLPEDGEKVLCQTMGGDGEPDFVLGHYAKGRWICDTDSNVDAWMHLPEPWEGRRENE